MSQSNGKIRIALSLSRPQLVQYLSARPADLRMKLREKELVTDTEAALLADIQDAHGAVGQARSLVDILLQERTEEEVREFMAGIEEYDVRIPQLIEENLNGGQAALEKLRDHLKTVYTAHRYHVIQSLPGEKFELDVQSGHYIMPLAFTVDQLQLAEIQRGLLPRGEMDSRYVRADFREVEEVLKALAESEDSRLAICTANAGTGKTVLIHRLVTQWMGDQYHMSNYIVVFALHVRDINIKKSIVDILNEGNNQSGYVPQEILSHLSHLLTSYETASKVLILLDGVDEKDIPQDTEIFQLLRGEIYKFVRVLFTSRPEGTVKLIKYLKPMYKIDLSGTTRQGVYDYLRKIITHTTLPSEKEVELLVKECKEKMVEFEILQIPLYLTLIGFILNEYWARKLSFQGFVVPRTVTQLFSVFMQVLLRVWLERIGRSEEAKVLMFKRSPIELDSNVPVGIRGKLVTFGKMCYYHLLKKNYTFTKTDLNKYFIEEKDVKDCGLFCVSEDQELFEVFLKHKQIQEYLAAIYLCHVEPPDSSFRDIVQSAETNKSSLCLNDIFKDIQWTVLFLFGLNSKLGRDILTKLKTHVCVIKPRHSVDLDYEARLVTEASDKTVCKVMGEVLTSAQIVERDDYSFRAPLSSVYDLCQGLSTQQRLTLLAQWYELEVTHKQPSHKTRTSKRHSCWLLNKLGSEEPYDNSSQEIENSNSLEIEQLDMINYFLLCEFAFPTVKSLHINWSHICDVGLIQMVFPALQALSINGGDPDLDEDIDCVMCSAQAKKPTTLTQITMKTFGDTLPPCSVRSLLRLHHLHTLKLRSDMLTHLSHDLCDASWPRLQTMEMCLVGIGDASCVSIWENLCHLLHHTPSLAQLTFGCEDNYTRPTLQTTAPIQSLLQHIIHQLPHLHTLRFHSVLHPCDMEVVCAGLAELTQVTTLGLGWRDVRGDLNWESGSVECDKSVLRVISRGVKSAPHLTHIQLVYGMVVWEEEVACQLRVHCPQLQIDTHRWDFAD